MGTEDSILAQGVKRDSLKAVCHEVIAKGDECQNHAIMIGQHCLHLSTAADAADYDKFEKKEASYVFVHEDDIIASWWKEDAIESLKELPGNEKTGQ